MLDLCMVVSKANGEPKSSAVVIASVRTSRRGHGEDSIYFDAEKNRYTGAVSLGHASDGARVRRKVYGKTRQDVRLKLKTLRSAIAAGVREPASCTVQAAVDDWLAQGLSGRSERTLTLYREGVKPLTTKQAQALVQASAGVLRADGMRMRRGPYLLHAYVVLLLTTGIRPEEARALRWDLADLDAGTVSVWRSARAGGDTKTARSRQTLKLAQRLS
jgi:integrase